MRTYWGGSIPDSCDACGSPISDRFADMKTTMGPWGNLCPKCAEHGPGLGEYGTGLGQEYAKQADGRWLKVRG